MTLDNGNIEVRRSYDGVRRACITEAKIVSGLSPEDFYPYFENIIEHVRTKDYCGEYNIVD